MAAKVTFVNQNDKSQSLTVTLFGPEKNRVKVAPVLRFCKSSMAILDGGIMIDAGEDGLSTDTFDAGCSYTLLLEPEVAQAAQVSSIEERFMRMEGLIAKLVHELQPVRRKCLISEFSRSEMEEVQEEGGVKFMGFQASVNHPLVTFKPRTPWKVYEWDVGQTERQQSAEYLKHLSDFVDVKSSHSAFADVAAMSHFLDYVASDRQFVGTTDVAISAESSVNLWVPGSSLRCIIVLKKHLGKTMSSAPFYQVIISLLLASMKYPDVDVVAFLTDLRDTWCIFWRDGHTIFHHQFQSSDDAVGYLEHYLEVGAGFWANPSEVRDTDQFDGLDVLCRAKRQKLLPGTQEHPPTDRLLELEGLLSVEEENYFDAQRLISAVRSSPIFWDLSRESVGLESRGSGFEPPPFMYT